MLGLNLTNKRGKIVMEKDLKIKFDEKIKFLEQELPTMKHSVNCAELTLTHILDVLEIDSYLFQ